MTIDPHHLACLEAALDLALESPRGPDGALTPEGKAHVQAALDQAGAPPTRRFDDVYHGPEPPGPGWVPAGVGPHGGKMWRRAGKGGGKAGDKGPLPKLTARQRQQAWHGSKAEARRVVLPPGKNQATADDREFDAKPLDDTHTLLRDEYDGKVTVVRTADLERAVAAHAALTRRREEREAQRQAEWEAKVKEVRPKIDPKLAAGVGQALQHGSLPETSLLELLTDFGPKLPEDAAKLLLRRMAFVGDLRTVTSGGKTRYELPDAARADAEKRRGQPG